MVYDMTILGEEKKIIHYDVMSRDHVTSQKNSPVKDFGFSENR